MKTYKKTFTALLVFLLGYCYQQATAQTVRSTYTTIASSLNPSTVGASVTFTSTTIYRDFFFGDGPVIEGTVTFSEGATVLAADVPVSAGLASFSTTALTTGSHVITAVYNGTASYATSSGLIAQTVDDPGSCPTYTGNIAYVNASATPGTNDGTTWANAFLTLQGALDAARTCGVTQIWVAQGTYVPTNYPIGAATTQFGGVLTSADFSFHLVNGVAMYGGFSGNETQLDQRNWRQNPTILSGSNARHHVVTSANDGLATQLDGFTITGGNANGNIQLTVEGQGFGANAGAGVALQNSSVTLSNLLVSGNSCPNSNGQGGGMQMRGGASVLTNVTFVGNSAGSGGGLFAQSAFTMTNCVFSGNTANGSGAGMFTGGTSNASATLTNVVFANNASMFNGGAILNNGDVTTLINCTFFGNTANVSGGTMYGVNQSTATDKNGIYYNNSNNGNSAYNGVFLNRDYDTFTGTNTLTGNDPLFVNAADPDGPDNRWMTPDDGLSIASNSPAINAGTATGAPVTDIRGFARTGNPDQGAYEYVVPGPTASVLSVNGLSIICRGTSTNLIVTITGGTSPYTVVYSDGTNNYTVNGYTSGTDIPVSPTVNTSYSLVSVADAASIAGTGSSGTPAITVTEPPMWYLDADGDTHYLSSVASCTSPGDGYTTTGGTLGDCDDDNPAVWQSALLYIDVDVDGYDAGQATICYGATVPAGYKTTTNGSDCNDNIAAINPGAIEICGNGIDDNCSGQVDESCIVCPGVISFSTTNISSTSAKLNWVASVDPVQWQVQYKTTKQGSKWVDVTVAGNLRSVIISSLLADQDYMWHIRAKCGTTWTDYSGSAKFKTLPVNASFVTTGRAGNPSVTADQMPTELTVQNYPNPFSKLTTIRYTLPYESTVNLRVYNQLGQQVAVLANSKQPAGTYQVNFDAASKGAGIYQYQLETRDAEGKVKTVRGKMLLNKNLIQ